MKLGFYSRLYRVQLVAVVGAEGLPHGAVLDFYFVLQENIAAGAGVVTATRPPKGRVKVQDLAGEGFGGPNLLDMQRVRGMCDF